MRPPNDLPQDTSTPFSKRVHAHTRKVLWEALARLRSGTAIVVPIGTKISATSVAEEAGVDRATLYRSHSVVLDEIRQTSAPISNKQPATKTKQPTDKRLAEYKLLAEEAQAQVTLLARHQYELGAQIDELTRLLKAKESIIRELNERLASLTAGRRVYSI
jgi:hypothetical protein